MERNAGNPFLVGDVVRCIDADNAFQNHLKEGQEYVVAGNRFDGKELVLEGVNFSWMIERFVLAGEQPAKPKPKKAKKRKPKKKPKVNVRALMRAHVANGNTEGICAMAWGCADNDYALSENMPCHAQLAYTKTDKEVKTLVYAVSHEIKKYALKEHKNYRRYVNYILSTSPWASCFLTNSAAIAFRYDILMDVSKSRNWIAGACIALREGSEHHIKNALFCHLLDKGHNPHTAWVMSRCYVLKEKNTVTFTGASGGHMVINDGVNFDQLIAFMRDGYTLGKDDSPYSKNHTGYAVCEYVAETETYKRDPKKYLRQWLTENVKTKKVGNGWYAKEVTTLEDVEAAASKLDKLFIKEAA